MLILLNLFLFLAFRIFTNYLCLLIFVSTNFYVTLLYMYVLLIFALRLQNEIDVHRFLIYILI